jgi:hypothetical protein
MEIEFNIGNLDIIPKTVEEENILICERFGSLLGKIHRHFSNVHFDFYDWIRNLFVQY